MVGVTHPVKEEAALFPERLAEFESDRRLLRVLLLTRKELWFIL